MKELNRDELLKITGGDSGNNPVAGDPVTTAIAQSIISGII